MSEEIEHLDGYVSTGDPADQTVASTQLDVLGLDTEEINLGPEEYPLEGVARPRRRTRERVSVAIQIGSMMTERERYRKFPRIHKDDRENRRMWNGIISNLFSPFNASSGIKNQLGTIIENALKKGVSREVLTAALTFEDIVQIGVKAKIVADAEGIIRISSDILEDGDISEDSDIPEEIEKELRDELEAFLLDYDQEIFNDNIAEHVAKQQKKYPEHNIVRWFEKPEIVKELSRFLKVFIKSIIRNEYRNVEKKELLEETPELISHEGLNGERRDLRKKANWLEKLETEKDSNLFDQLRPIIRDMYEEGIDIDRTVAFLQSEEISRIMVGQLMYAGSSFTGKCEEMNEACLDSETKRKLDAVFEYIKSEYNPKHLRGNVRDSVDVLRREHRKCGVEEWLDLEETMSRFQGLLAEHIRPTVLEIYTNIGQRSMEGAGVAEGEGRMREFISLYISSILKKLPSGSEESEKYVLDIKELEFLFTELIPQIQKKNKIIGTGTLRRIVVELCEEKIEQSGRSYALLYGPSLNVSNDNIESKEALIREINRFIENNQAIQNSQITSLNSFADPTVTPENISKHYEDWFDERGRLVESKYHKYLLDESEKDSDPSDIAREIRLIMELKARWTRIFESVNEGLEVVSNVLGMLPIPKSERVIKANDMAELIKIACTSRDSVEERFEARRKIVLASIIDKLEHSPEYVFRERNIAKMNESFRLRGNLKISDEELEFFYLDHPDGTVREIKFEKKNGHKLEEERVLAELERVGEKIMIEDRECYIISSDNELLSSSTSLKVEGATEDGIIVSLDIDKEAKGYEELQREHVKSVKLRPTNFHGVDCFVMLNDGEFIRIKTILAAMGKTLRGKTVNDWQATTFVVKTIEDMMKVIDVLESQYTGFVRGRLIKVENRQKDKSKSIERKESNVGDNPSKSEEYNTFRYVVYLRVEIDGDPVDIALEIRILILEDLFVSLSEHHEAGHSHYKMRRWLDEVIEQIVPYELFPDYYEESEPHPDDPRKKTRLQVVKLPTAENNPNLSQSAA